MQRQPPPSCSDENIENKENYTCRNETGKFCIEGTWSLVSGRRDVCEAHHRIGAAGDIQMQRQRTSRRVREQELIGCVGNLDKEMSSVSSIRCVLWYVSAPGNGRCETLQFVGAIDLVSCVGNARVVVA